MTRRFIGRWVAHGPRRTALAAATGTILAIPIMALAWVIPLHGQSYYASPEVGWSNVRGPTLGARAGRKLVGGLDLVVQGLVSFPDEDAVVDPGASAQRSSWRASINAAYTFDPDRPLAPYVGVGGRYGRATLSVVSGGYRASEVRGGFGVDVFGGIRLPRLPLSPWIEYRRSGRLPIWTGGIRWSFGSP